MTKAAVSIPSNVAEGHTRQSTKEFLNFVSVAQASLAEVETQLEIAVRLRYTTAAEISLLQEQATTLGKQLYALRDALAKRR